MYDLVLFTMGVFVGSGVGVMALLICQATGDHKEAC